MTRRSLALLAVSALAAVAACAGPTDPDCPGCLPADEGLFRAQEGRAFLIRELTLPPATDDAAAGLDLDGIDSRAGSPAPDASCEEYTRDFDSRAATGLVGVDNGGEGLVRLLDREAEGSTQRAALDDAVRAGRIRWAMRIGALPAEGPSFDLPIEVFVVDADQPLETDGDGLPAADQTLRARRVATVTASPSDVFAFGLVDAPSGLDVVDDDVLLLPFDDFRLGGVVVAPSADGRTLQGEIGGSFSAEAIAARGDEIMPGLGDTLRSLLENIADLEPTPADPTRCQRLSFGFAFDAVPVELVEE